MAWEKIQVHQAPQTSPEHNDGDAEEDGVEIGVVLFDVLEHLGNPGQGSALLTTAI